MWKMMQQPGAAVAGRTISLNGPCAGASAVETGEDPRGLAQLFDRHAAVVLSLCRGHLGDRAVEDADDACQETFIRAYRKLVDGGEGRHEIDVADAPGVRKWLYAIARHVCRERLRARRRREHHELIARMNNGVAAHSGPAASALNRAERCEMLAHLTSAIARLPERERLALHLEYLEVHPAQAACEAMGISRSGYYKLLARARVMLARQLSNL